MAADECKGYACPPSTTVDMPECPGGWEIGNNAAMCATQQPAMAPLAATGPDIALSLGFVALALALASLGLALVNLAHARQQRRIRLEAEEARQEGLAELDAKMAAAGFVTMPDGSVRRVPTR